MDIRNTVKAYNGYRTVIKYAKKPPRAAWRTLENSYIGAKNKYAQYVESRPLLPSQIALETLRHELLLEYCPEYALEQRIFEEEIKRSREGVAAICICDFLNQLCSEDTNKKLIKD